MTQSTPSQEPPAIPALYAGEVCYGDRGSSVGFSYETLEEVRAKLDYFLGYYTGLGYEIRDYKIATYCRNCGGTGEVLARKKKSVFGRRVACPVCKGQPELEIITKKEQV